MKAASRESLSHTLEALDNTLAQESGVAVATLTGMELFEVTQTLEDNRELRVALVDESTSDISRKALANSLFGARVSPVTMQVLETVVSSKWSSGREMVAGLTDLSRRALLRGAENEGQLEQVEDELFRLSRILDREGELTQLLSDRAADPARKRNLLADVLYGKVTKFTEALALQVIERPQHNLIDDIAELAEEVAQLRGRTVAHVVSAGELNESQRAVLAEKLGNIYGRAMSIHSEVDTSLLGGMTVRVGDEVIDGSTAGKLARLRASMK
ncbi:MAG: F0F1 ATP synthase subunit delta [Corynebacterium sp.]|nr:F0F1 ATP synthase subunit delta [Corynebacterium sp.]